MAYTPYTPYQPYQPVPYSQQPAYQQRPEMAGTQYTQQQLAPQPAPAAAQSGYICRPVTSREEALGVQVDFMGAGTVMPDLAHGMIFLKRFNPNTGASDLLEFTFQPPQQPQPEPQYVTVDAFRALEEKVEQLQRPAGKATRKNETADE